MNLAPLIDQPNGFHNRRTWGVYEKMCRTLDSPRSANVTLARILGREATGRKTELTWDELIKDNKKIEFDLTGLKA